MHCICSNVFMIYGCRSRRDNSAEIRATTCGKPGYQATITSCYRLAAKRKNKSVLIPISSVPVRSNTKSGRFCSIRGKHQKRPRKLHSAGNISCFLPWCSTINYLFSTTKCDISISLYALVKLSQARRWKHIVR